ncbi:MAG: hypothetical protein R3Y27_07000 [Clostridia bacterium]
MKMPRFFSDDPFSVSLEFSSEFIDDIFEPAHKSTSHNDRFIYSNSPEKTAVNEQSQENE